MSVFVTSDTFNAREESMRTFATAVVAFVVFVLAGLPSESYAQLSGSFPIECDVTSTGALTCNTDGSCSVAAGPTFACDAAGLASRHASASCTSQHGNIQCTAGNYTNCVSANGFEYCYLVHRYASANTSSVSFPDTTVGTASNDLPGGLEFPQFSGQFA
jgi:hypothetical protein